MFLTAALLAATMASASAAEFTTPITLSVWQLASAGNANSCMDNGMPTTTLVVEANSCTMVKSDESTFYAKSGSCADKDGPWSVSLYLDSNCSTTSLSNFEGSDACDCTTGAAGPQALAALASCDSMMNDCYYQSTFMESDMCDMDGYANTIQSTTAISGWCYGGSKTTCNGGTSSSSWTWASYEHNNCTGAMTAMTSADACGDCATIEDADFYGNGTSAMVNCGGYVFSNGDCPSSSDKKSGAAAKFSGAVALSAAAAAVAAMLL